MRRQLAKFSPMSISHDYSARRLFARIDSVLLVAAYADAELFLSPNKLGTSEKVQPIQA